MAGDGMPTGNGSKIDRRRLLKIAGAGSLALTAGCMGDDDDDIPDDADLGDGSNSNNEGNDTADDDNGSEDDTDEGDAADNGTVAKDSMGIAHWYSGNPNDVNYNPDGGQESPVAYEPLAFTTDISHEETGNFTPHFAESWENDAENHAFTINLAETSWWDGEAITSEDVRDNFLISTITSSTMRSFIDSFETPDDQTIIVNYEGDRNPLFLEDQLVNFTINRKPGYYEEFLEGIEDAEDDSDYEALSGNLIEHRIDDRIGNSLYQHVDATTEAIIAELNDGHINADLWEGVDRFDIYNAEGEQQRHQRFLGGDADTMAATLPQEQELPDNAEESFAAEFSNASFKINHGSAPLGDIRVRKALAYLLDRESLSELMNPNEFPAHDYLTGPSHSHEEFFTEEFLEGDLEHYNPTDPEKAEELLNDAGLTKEDGTWMHEGEPWELEIISHGFAAWVAACQTYVDALNGHGINATYVNVEVAAIASRMEDGEYDLRMHLSGSGVTPLSAFESELQGQHAGIREFPGDPEQGGEIEVPYPIGDPDGDLETVRVEELLDELSRATDESTLTELREELAWCYNQTLPSIQVAPRQIGHTVYVDNWELLSEDDPLRGTMNPAFNYQPVGALTPKSE